MAKGTIASFDADSGKGYIHPEHDTDGEKIPFEIETDDDDYHTGQVFSEGDEVTYEVEGGLAGTMATDVRRIATRGYE